tara:strand:+ start:626 stop:1594 length:969 start_codon:yes stop_codon:yes gene_type:complete
MAEAELGSYLSTVEERDIDLLLLEEFLITDEFVAWFSAELGFHAATPAGAWHSVSDVDGETDLLLRVHTHGQCIGVLIENKIAAPEQHRQAERYHLRGARYCETGVFDTYRTVICAPQEYLRGLAKDSAYQHQIPYEVIAEWFNNQEGRRAAWRHNVMREAVEQGRRGYAMIVCPITTTFHMEYWEHLRRKHPRIQMKRPGNRGKASTWIIMHGIDFPAGVKLHHKLDQQVVELGFERRRVDEILDAKADWPDEIVPIQKGKTAALLVQVQYVDINAPFQHQIEAVEEALAAAYSLIPFANLLVRNEQPIYPLELTTPPTSS